MIDRIYKIILVISNNELRGNVTPEEFNLALYNAILERYEEYFYDLNRQANRKNKGFTTDDYGNTPSYIRQKIKHYLGKGTLPSSTGTYDLPEDLRYLESVTVNDISTTEVSSPAVFKLLKDGCSVKASSDCPVFLQSGGEIEIVPETEITDEVKATYLRNPKIPKWTYTVVNGVELFNPSATDFQDADIHVSDEEIVIRRTLMKLGINLKEADLAQYMIREEDTKFNQENVT